MHIDQCVDMDTAENMQNLAGMFMPQQNSSDKQPELATTIKNLADMFMPQIQEEKPEIASTIQNIVNMFVP